MKPFIYSIISIVIIVGCEYKNIPTDNFIQLGTTKQFAFSRIIAFDSVRDARCPSGLACLWSGSGTCFFRLIENNGKTSSFVLNTLTSSIESVDEVSMNGCSIRLLELTPYPAANVRFAYNAYRAKLQVRCK